MKTRARTRPWLALPGAVAFLLAGLGASTCRVPDVELDQCNTNEDCSSLPGTTCLSGLCMCVRPSEIFCGGACRPHDECAPKWAGSGSAVGTGGSGGAGGAGGAGGSATSTGSAGGCTTAADCPQPSDARCGTATCTSGVCGLDFVPFSALTTSQVLGDCKTRYCDGAGNVIEISDPNDTYNDGLQCTFDVCEDGKPTVELYGNGVKCPAAGNGVCYEGECVLCIADLVACDGSDVCDGVFCVPMYCVNNVWDQGSGETAKNCGGPCRPCDAGFSCNVDDDCLDKVCKGGKCQLPTSSDGVQNDNESGIDCGGPPTYPRCEAGQNCKDPSDCASGVCWVGKCQAPTCKDGIENGDEDGWDCGGSCSQDCP